MKRILIFTLLFVGGCLSSPNWVKTTDTKIDNIESVFINRPDDYTILIKEKEQLIAKTLKPYKEWPDYAGWVKVFTDSKEGIWANVKEYKDINHRNRPKTEIEIHLRSANDIQGGQWREKIGKGTEKTGRVNKIQ